MNIYAEQRTKIIFAYPDSGYSSDQKRAKKHLVVGKAYTVEKTIVHDRSTDVYLREVPNISFNSVLFE